MAQSVDLSGRELRTSTALPAVEVREVTKVFPGPHGETVVAVEDVTLTIQEGEFFSLLGPSGCGKTTTLRMIAGFELPTRGEIWIHGRPMGSTPPYRRPVNTVFQNYALFPHMTIYENVAFGLEMEGVPKDEIRRRVLEVLELVRLPGMESRRPRQLSGGQQQRVALARALVKQPEVLLLDEPLGALDLKLRKAMQLELKHIQHRVGITFIYVTHDQEEALTMSDRIAVMDRGQVLQVGAPAEIYEAPVNRFVADFIGESNLLEGQIARLEGERALIYVDGVELAAHRHAQEVQLHQAVTFALRPEKISLLATTAEVAPGHVSVTGVVEERVYIGTDTRYMVRIGDQAQLVVRMQNLTHQDADHFQPGDRVQLSWDPAVARVLVE